MEFFDLEGTNDEEKAQALDILTNETAGVEVSHPYDQLVSCPFVA